MNKRLFSAILAAGLLCSVSACDFSSNVKPEITTAAEETTTEETAATEETTTTEATTTAEETTTSEETTTTEETTAETSKPTVKPTNKPTKKPKKKKSNAPKVPKGYFEDAWGKTYKGKKYYVIRNSSATVYRAWINGKWVRVYPVSELIDSYYQWRYYKDAKHQKLLFQYNNYDY